MGRQRREFSPEYKDEAVKLVLNTGRTVAVVARELGVNEATLGRWVNLHRDRQGVGDAPLSETERAELARLRKEVSDLRLDRAFLKKASLFFAQEASDTNVKRSS
jgi:transposase